MSGKKMSWIEAPQRKSYTSYLVEAKRAAQPQSLFSIQRKSTAFPLGESSWSKDVLNRLANDNYGTISSV